MLFKSIIAVYCENHVKHKYNLGTNTTVLVCCHVVLTEQWALMCSILEECHLLGCYAMWLF
jgi:hypothetical protein